MTMSHEITLIPGNEGESTHLIDAVCRMVDELPVELSWKTHFLEDYAPTEPMLQSIRKTKCAFMPFLRGRRDEGRPAPVVELRRALGIFANIRPVHSLTGLTTRFDDVDLVVVRETTEDVYASLEHESIPGTFESLKVTTREACERIARFAFELARETGRKKITTVHKSNIMKKSDGMFLDVSREVAGDYSDVEHNERIVDALCMQLVMYPDDFDILLCGNLFGDIVADLAAGLVGGKDNCPSVNVGPDGMRIFTAGHGRDPRVENSPKGNPLSLLFASVLMLRELDEEEAADQLMDAVSDTVEDGNLPIGSGGDLTLNDFVEAVTERLR
jgi:isocitrate dehydrogenase (NAD+)